MLLLFIQTILCPKKLYIDAARSVLGSAVDDDGYSQQLSLKGDYFAVSQALGTESYTEFGYNNVGSSAYAVLKEPTTTDGFKVVYKLVLMPSTNYRISFWGNRNKENDDAPRNFYGRNDMLEGFFIKMDYNDKDKNAYFSFGSSKTPSRITGMGFKDTKKFNLGFLGK